MSIADLKVRLADIQGVETPTMGLEAVGLCFDGAPVIRPLSMLRLPIAT